MGSYYPIQMSSAATLLRGVLYSPDDYVKHVRRLTPLFLLLYLTFRSHAGRVILKAVYGYDVKGHQDKYVILAAEAMSGLTQTIHTGSFLVDFIPILKYVPCS